MARRSEYVGRRQLESFFRAERYARVLGRSPTVFVTINYGLVACEPEHVSKLFERLRDNHFTRWFRYQSSRRGSPDYGPATYLWVIEAAAAHTHVHWNVYMPEALLDAFRAKLARWVTKSGGLILEDAAIHTKAPDYKAGLYMMKGGHPKYTRHFGIRYPRYQGPVEGKRCGFSENLGARAIKKPALDAADRAA